MVSKALSKDGLYGKSFALHDVEFGRRQSRMLLSMLERN